MEEGGLQSDCDLPSTSTTYCQPMHDFNSHPQCSPSSSVFEINPPMANIYGGVLTWIRLQESTLLRVNFLKIHQTCVPCSFLIPSHHSNPDISNLQEEGSWCHVFAEISWMQTRSCCMCHKKRNSDEKTSGLHLHASFLSCQGLLNMFIVFYSCCFHTRNGKSLAWCFHNYRT